MQQIINRKYLKLLDKINQQELPKNKVWLEQQVRKGRMTYKWLKFLEFVTEKMEFIYPDLWDIQLSIMDDIYNEVLTNYIGVRYNKTTITKHFCFELIIKFPEIDITNTPGLHHTIRDLYVKLPFMYCEEINNFILTGIEGRRGKLTKNEVLSQYSHSHLSYDVRNFKQFCLGDTEIRKHSEDMIQAMDKLGFESLLFQLDTYVRWESIEGVPFNEIRKIASDEPVPNMSTSMSNAYIEHVLRKRFGQEMIYQLEWKLNNSTVELVDNEALDNYLKLSDDFRDYHAIGYDSVVVSKKANGEYKKYESTRDVYLPTTSILFRGQRIPVELVDETSNNNMYVHPFIKQALKIKLQNEANNAITNYNRTERINKFGYPKEITR